MDIHDSGSEILNSWKEVAHYLGRGTRTVQRWERDLGLPVHRPRGKRRSAVMALRQDLDAWVGSRPQKDTHHDVSDIKQSQEDLGNQLVLLEQVLRQMPCGLAITEAPSGKLLRVNSYLEGILGQPLYPAASVADYTHFPGLQHNGKPYQPEEWPMALALKGQAVNRKEITWVRGDGSHIALTVSSTPVLSRAGRIIAIVTLFLEPLRNSPDSIASVTVQTRCLAS